MFSCGLVLRGHSSVCGHIACSSSNADINGLEINTVYIGIIYIQFAISHFKAVTVREYISVSSYRRGRYLPGRLVCVCEPAESIWFSERRKEGFDVIDRTRFPSRLNSKRFPGTALAVAGRSTRFSNMPIADTTKWNVVKVLYAPHTEVGQNNKNTCHKTVNIVRASRWQWFGLTSVQSVYIILEGFFRELMGGIWKNKVVDLIHLRIWHLGCWEHFRALDSPLIFPILFPMVISG